jgi:hypothetical protein
MSSKSLHSHPDYDSILSRLFRDLNKIISVMCSPDIKAAKTSSTYVCITLELMLNGTTLQSAMVKAHVMAFGAL